MALQEETRLQMEMLRGLRQSVEAGEAATVKAEQGQDVKIAKLTDYDNIESYLTTFEQLMTAYKVKQEHWAFKLVP